MSDLATILTKFRNVHPSGSGYMACCPAHEDGNASLSIGTTADGKILLNCMAGCAFDAVIVAAGISARDLFPKVAAPSKPASREIVTTYPYCDKDGTLLYEVVRFKPKDFRQRRPDGQGGYIWDMKGIDRVLYRLPELLAAKSAETRIYVSEGEKDVDNLRALGQAATCNVGGAGKWKASYTAELAGAHVVIIADKDDPGRAHAVKVAGELYRKAASVRVIELPDRGVAKVKDASDWLTASGTAAELDQIVGAAPEWEPPATARAGQEQARPITASEQPHMGTDTSPITAAAAADPLPCTDAGFAERLAWHAKDLAFFHGGRGMWFAWDGKRWRESHGELERFAVETARLIKEEARRYPTSAEDKGSQEKAQKLFGFALKCEEIGEINAAIKLAVAVPGMTKAVGELDADPMLFCCENGTIDLRTGELRPHRREDLITKRSFVTFDPAAQSPVFDKFISGATGGDLVFETYLRRAAGYSLTGDIGEKCLFFLYNHDTDTGKSTFLEALRTVAGEYSTVIDFGLLCADGRGHSQPKYDVAKLLGARVVSCSEIEEGQTLDKSLVKRLTGGDRIRARDCGEKSFEFDPVFKLWLAANDPPIIPGDDPATWNRMRRVPFGHHIPKELRDPAIQRDLKNPHSDAARAFLAWAVRGAVEWAQSGLGTCASVEKSTAAYQTESDSLHDFFTECCRFTPDAWAANSDLRRVYERWAANEGIKQKYWVSPKKIASKLTARGCTSIYKNRGRAWLGIELLSDAETDPVQHVQHLTQEMGGGFYKESSHENLPQNLVSSVANVVSTHETANQPTFIGEDF